MLMPFLPAASGAGVGVGSVNADTKNPFTFRGLVMNNPSDNADETYEIVNAVIADQMVLQTEPLPQNDGQQSYIPRKSRKLIHIDGIIHAKTLGKLVYMGMQMNYLFDPVNCFWADTAATIADNKGFLPLTLSVPTSDTTNYPTGLIEMVAYVRATQRPVQMGSKLTGYNARFNLVLEMIDPRIYYATLTSFTLNDGTDTNHTSVTEYPTYPTISLTLSSAADVIQINRTSPNNENGSDMNVRINPAATLDGAAAGNGDIVTLNMGSGKAYKNGVLREDFVMGGYMDYWPILPGANVIRLDGGSSTFSAKTLSYNRAFA
jgi:hypothetical protein